MATYAKIQDFVRKKYGVTVKTCWIAHVKEKYGLTRGPAPNRAKGKRANPCPKRYWSKIEDALRNFEMIR